MDRMFVGAASAVTTNPEKHSAGNRSPAQMRCIATQRIDAGIALAATGRPLRAASSQRLRFPVAQAARWRRRGEPVQRGRACGSVASSRRSLCT